MRAYARSYTTVATKPYMVGQNKEATTATRGRLGEATGTLQRAGARAPCNAGGMAIGLVFAVLPAESLTPVWPQGVENAKH